MVPRVATKGRSFKGAGLYYLHDKQARSSNRVIFTRTLNLPTDDPDKAIGWMAYTAMRQADIKAAAGGAMRGRKMQKPVYSYSLSWAPDETPSHEEMEMAAQETLRRLKLDSHEAILIAHNDRPHPHIHVIVNRVNPDTGIAADLSKDHLALSRWAQEYELSQGLVRCEQRVTNNRERQKGRFMKDRQNLDTKTYRDWQEARVRAEDDLRRRQQQDLTQAQAREREQQEQAARRETEDLRRSMKEQQRYHWSDLYKHQKEERTAFEKAQESPLGRLRYWLNNRHIDRWGGDSLERQGMMSKVYQVLSEGNTLREKVARQQLEERKALAEKLHRQTTETLAPIIERQKQAREQLRTQQAAAQQDLAATQRDEKAKRLQQQREGADRPAFEFDRARKQEPEKQARPASSTPRSKERPRAPGAKRETPAPAPEEDASSIFRPAAQPAPSPEQDVTSDIDFFRPSGPDEAGPGADADKNREQEKDQEQEPRPRDRGPDVTD